MACDFDGRILAEASPGPGEKIVVAPIDIPVLREERERRIGHDMRSHHRAELYQALGEPLFPQGTGAESRIVETQTELINSAKDTLQARSRE